LEVDVVAIEGVMSGGSELVVVVRLVSVVAGVEDSLVLVTVVVAVGTMNKALDFRSVTDDVCPASSVPSSELVVVVATETLPFELGRAS
jgi:hypothetical protein